MFSEESVDQFGVFPPISEILPFENRLRIFTMPRVRYIGKDIRDTLGSNPSPCPAFWTSYFKEGHHLVTDTLPHTIPNTMAWFGEYLPQNKTYTYMICVACPADTPVPGGFVYRDAPAACIAHGRIGSTPNEAYALQCYDDLLHEQGLARLDEGWGEFYPYPGKITFCLLFTCKLQKAADPY
jgi:hypothetical protein